MNRLFLLLLFFLPSNGKDLNNKNAFSYGRFSQTLKSQLFRSSVIGGNHLKGKNFRIDKAPRWAFACNDGYNKYYRKTIVTNVFNINRIPGASACKCWEDFWNLVIKYVQNYYDTNFPGGGFGGVDLLPLMSNNAARGGSTLNCMDIRSPKSLNCECFIMDKNVCESSRKYQIEKIKEYGRSSIIFVNLLEDFSVESFSKSNLASTKTSPKSSTKVNGSSVGSSPPSGAESIWSDKNQVITRGLDYYTGSHGYPNDYAMSLTFFKRADELGDPTGNFYLGNIFSYGKGVSQDYCLALKYYSRAAENGLPEAMLALGQYYKYGKCPEKKNVLVARQWFQKIVDSVEPNSLNRYIITKAKEELIGL